jgi:glucosyl-dolichyl phosphate glucuronosyltransferase
MSLDFAVVICTYASERWSRLHEAVRSVQRQTLAPREVIVVVDHNDSLLARVRREFDGVLVVDNSDARGLRGARNSGLQAATALCVAFLDDDAEASERWLELLAGPYQDPEVAGVGGLTHPVWEGGRPNWFPYEFEWVVGGAYRGMPLARQEVRNLWGGNMSFRRELVTKMGGFRIGYSCDDTELCIRLRQRWPSKRFVLIPEAGVLHHVERSRMTMKRFVSRCYFEGGSKAVISRLAGTHDGLASERRYTRAVLPMGLKHGVVDFAWRRDPAGMARATMIVAGLTSAVAGYLVGQATPVRTARKRGWNGEPIGRTRRPMSQAADEHPTSRGRAAGRNG